MQSDETADTNRREYYGEWRDNKIDGLGMYSWPDGRKFYGAWKNN